MCPFSSEPTFLDSFKSNLEREANATTYCNTTPNYTYQTPCPSDGYHCVQIVLKNYSRYFGCIESNSSQVPSRIQISPVNKMVTRVPMTNVKLLGQCSDLTSCGNITVELQESGNNYSTIAKVCCCKGKHCLEELKNLDKWADLGSKLRSKEVMEDFKSTFDSWILAILYASCSTLISVSLILHYYTKRRRMMIIKRARRVEVESNHDGLQAHRTVQTTRSPSRGPPSAKLALNGDKDRVATTPKTSTKSSNRQMGKAKTSTGTKISTNEKEKVKKDRSKKGKEEKEKGGKATHTKDQKGTPFLLF
ncbi:hypothetical protein WR25_08455 [Diploscapter pachys]|uniref:Uncharacterized protein n=1 Tax=Diploscapter pachys TaxID=2018661 RepID=A0A2A2M016_9BILA|nr:hypothetical protein WR25_08455 [Diploscapter pachys]